jgi:[ribosomal protein S5]-alanine N-acetyltransferase
MAGLALPMRFLPQALIGPPQVRLDGQAVFVRSGQPKDWEEWAHLREVSRGHLMPWEPTWPGDALTKSAFLRRLRRHATEWREDEGYSFFVFERSSGALAGGVGLSNIRRGVAQMGTMGYWVGQPFARRGLTSEGARLVLGFAFGQLGLHRIEAACLPSNEASRRLLEKVGFQQEGYARGYLRIDGRWADHLLYGIVRDEWRG